MRYVTVHPEMFHMEGQTSKVDVWSLFVMMLWTLNVGEFCQGCDQFKFFDTIDTMTLAYMGGADAKKLLKQFQKTVTNFESV